MANARQQTTARSSLIPAASLTTKITARPPRADLREPASVAFLAFAGDLRGPALVAFLASLATCIFAVFASDEPAIPRR